jgi:hypothetical protein
VKREKVKRGQDNQFAKLNPREDRKMHPAQVMKLGGTFWDEAIHPKMRMVRWDLFEENFCVFLLETLGLHNEIFNKLVWKDFFKDLFTKLGSTELESNPELPICPANPLKSKVYKGFFITKANFQKYLLLDGLFISLKASFQDRHSAFNKPIEVQLEQFKDKADLVTKPSSVSQYADNSWYKGGRLRFRRSGRGKLMFAVGDCSYEGEFENGHRHGYGVLKWKEEFGFMKDIVGGDTTSSNSDYTGAFAFDMRQGMGTAKWADGSEYTGNWDENNQQYGLYKWPPANRGSNSMTVTREYKGFWNGHLVEG